MDPDNPRREAFDAIASHPDLADLAAEPYRTPGLTAVLLACAVLAFGGGIVAALILRAWTPVLAGLVGSVALTMAGVVYAAAVAPPNQHHKRR